MIVRRVLVAIAAAVFLIAGSTPGVAGTVKALLATDLRVNALAQPLGLDDTTPDLSWQVTGGVPEAYEVRAATSVDRLERPDLWSSGKVSQLQAVGARYAGVALRSRQRVVWQVRLFSEGAASPWSQPSWWEMGLLGNSDWEAQWIEYPGWTPTVDGAGTVSSTATQTPFPLFARSFDLTTLPARARLYATGLGMFAATVNGDPVGEAVLEPGQTDYIAQVQYRAYDITRLLRIGRNRIELATGAGMFGETGCTPTFCRGTPAVRTDRYYCLVCSNNGETGPPRVIAQLDLTSTNGARQTIGTGPDWQTILGPTTSTWQGGEDFNAVRNTLVHATDALWLPAITSPLSTTTTPRATTPLVANPRPPTTVVATKKPVAVTQPVPGTYVFDFGKNFSGWPRLHLTGAASGAVVSMLPAERLLSNGLADQSTMTFGGNLCTGLSGTECSQPLAIRYDYTADGQPDQVWHPQFTYNGFRYLQVTGLVAPPTADTVLAMQVQAANEAASTFTASVPLLNEIHTLVRNAIDANMQSVLTDCPNREKGAYTGDALQAITHLLNAYDMRAYMRATVRNFAEAQHPDGMVPATGPEWVNGDNGPLWGGAIVMIPWNLYTTYGDQRTLETYYSNMQRYLAHVAKQASQHVLPDSYGLGDWVTPDGDAGGFGGAGTTPIGLFTTAAWYEQLRTMAKISALLGRDGRAYDREADAVSKAFVAKFYDPKRHTFSVGTQSADITALELGLVPAKDRAAVLNHLLATIKSADGLIKVGSPTLPRVLRLLHDTGHDEVIYRWATATAFPSYGHILALGNTTMTENWTGTTNSLNHHFLGGIDAWFTSSILGITQAPDSVAYRSPVLRPQVLGSMTSARGSYAGPFGPLSSDWRLTGTRTAPHGFSLQITIPSSSPGDVGVPLLGSARKITMDGRLVWDGVRAVNGAVAVRDGDAVVFEGISGSHTFTWAAPGPPAQNGDGAPEGSLPATGGPPAAAGMGLALLVLALLQRRGVMRGRRR